MSNDNNDEVDDFINKALGIKSPVKTQNNDGWKEINLDNRFSGMLPKTKEDLAAFSMQQKVNNQAQQFGNGAAANSNQAFIKEGFSVYRPISNMNNNVDLATPYGNTSELNGKEFVVHSKKRFLIIEDQRSTIDMSNLNQHNFVTLVIIEAPFIGKLLVPEQALRTIGQRNKTILRG
jgi:hypothetical protein